MPQHAIRSLDVPESTKIQRQTYVILWKQSVQHIKLTFLCVCELAYQVDPDQSPPPLGVEKQAVVPEVTFCDTSNSLRAQF